MLEKKDEITYGGEQKARSHPHEIGICAANGWQQKNAKQHCRRADEIEKKGLLFIPHRIEHRVGNHCDAHGQEQPTAVANHFPCKLVRIRQATHVVPERKEERYQKTSDQKGKFQAPCEVCAQSFAVVSVKVLGQLGHEHEREGTDDG